MTQTISRLIAQHALAHSRLQEAPDSVHEDGSKNETFEQVHTAEEHALTALVSAETDTIADLKQKAAYLLFLFNLNDELMPSQYEAFLASLIGLRLSA